MEGIYSVIILWLACTVKFAIAIPALVLAGYSYWQFIIVSISGGLTGFFAFYYFGEAIKSLCRRTFRKKSGQGKKFRRFTRFIITVKSSYGLAGLALTTPCILSIPVGSLLAVRYFGKDKRTIPFMILSIVAWSFIFTTFFKLF